MTATQDDVFAAEFPTSSTALALLDECRLMHSRIAALLKCEFAVATLAAEDVFGHHYPEYLVEDLSALERVIQLAEREIRHTPQT